MTSPAETGRSPSRPPTAAGHEHARARLRRTLEQGRMGGAYLLYGPEGVDKAGLALSLAAGMVCPRAGHTLEACGTCPSCRAIHEKSHPDVRWVEPSTAAGNITLQQVRDLRMGLNLATAGPNLKVAVIDRADRLTPEAGNALLKTLEEPPGPCVVILTASELSSVPDTIQSRCIRLYVSSSGDGAGEWDEQAFEWLTTVAGDRAAEVDRLARSVDRPGSAPAKVDEHLQAMIWLWRDLAVWSWTRRSELLMRPQILKTLEPWASRMSGPQAAQALETLIRARRMIRENTNRRLALVWAWISLRRALRPPGSSAS